MGAAPGEEGAPRNEESLPAGLDPETAAPVRSGSFWSNPLSFVLYSWFTPLLIKVHECRGKEWCRVTCESPSRHDPGHTRGFTSQIVQGWKRQLEAYDLFSIPDETRTDAVQERYFANWEALVARSGPAALARARRGENAALLLRNFVQLHWRRVVISLALALFYTASSFAGPLLLNEIVKFLQTPAALQTVRCLQRKGRQSVPFRARSALASPRACL